MLLMVLGKGMQLDWRNEAGRGCCCPRLSRFSSDTTNAFNNRLHSILSLSCTGQTEANSLFQLMQKCAKNTTKVYKILYRFLQDGFMHRSRQEELICHQSSQFQELEVMRVSENGDMTHSKTVGQQSF